MTEIYIRCNKAISFFDIANDYGISGKEVKKVKKSGKVVKALRENAIEQVSEKEYNEWISRGKSKDKPKPTPTPKK